MTVDRLDRATAVQPGRLRQKLDEVLAKPSATAEAFRVLGEIVDDRRREFLRAAPAAVFYRHPYWMVVRRCYLDNHPTCEYCYERSATKVIHESWSHRGDEHRHLENLKACCSLCGSVEHPDVIEIDRDGDSVKLTNRKRSSRARSGGLGRVCGREQLTF